MLLEPPYPMSRVNQDVLLHKGILVVEQEGKRTTCPGKIYLAWTPRPSIRFRLSPGTRANAIYPGNLRLLVPKRNLAADAFFTRWGTGPLLGVLRRPADLITSKSQDPSVSHLLFQLPNMQEAHGEGVRHGGHVHFARQNCMGQGWQLIVDPVPHSDALVKNLNELGGFAFTHTGRLERDDGRSFRLKEAKTLVARIRVFLSFVRGSWTAPMLVRAVNRHGSVVWEQWATWSSIPWSSVQSWVPRFEGYSDAFPGFLSVTAEQEDFEVLRSVVHWYVEANNQGGGVPGGLIHLQAALELLSWQTLVRKDGILDAEGFEKLNGYSKLRALLKVLRVPTTIPPALVKEMRAPKDLPKDLVDLIVRTRNSLVHPPHRPPYRLPETVRVVGAWKAALWCVEMVLLRLMNYNGKYWNRTSGSFNSVSSEQVPWASKLEPA